MSRRLAANMKKKMLFVTYLDEHPEEGFSYVIELAKVMNEDLMVFLLQKKRLPRNRDTVESTNALTERIEDGTEGQNLTTISQDIPATEGKLAGLFYKCKKSGIKVDLYSLSADAVSAIEEYFRHKNGIDIVLLGPNISEHSHITQQTLQKLTNTVARPIITMEKQISSVPI
jgi:hypothetical protein